MLPDNLIEQTVSRFPRYAKGKIRIDPLEKGGSDRKYYRIRVTNEHSLILVRYGDSREENRYYCAIAEFLAGLGLNVPEIYHHDEQERLIWMEDLGETDLWSYRDMGWEIVGGYYEKTLDEMVMLHLKGCEALAVFATDVAGGIQRGTLRLGAKLLLLRIARAGYSEGREGRERTRKC